MKTQPLWQGWFPVSGFHHLSHTSLLLGFLIAASFWVVFLFCFSPPCSLLLWHVCNSVFCLRCGCVRRDQRQLCKGNRFTLWNKCLHGEIFYNLFCAVIKTPSLSPSNAFKEIAGGKKCCEMLLVPLLYSLSFVLNLLHVLMFLFHS